MNISRLIEMVDNRKDIGWKIKKENEMKRKIRSHLKKYWKMKVYKQHTVTVMAYIYCGDRVEDLSSVRD